MLLKKKLIKHKIYLKKTLKIKLYFKVIIMKDQKIV